nr:protein glutamine dumper 2-like [Tanacetum cinerariifolium]
MAPSASVIVQRSPWHSPVPYLFGGLAAMLGLIAFALLILACSYWKISPARERDLEAGEDNTITNQASFRSSLFIRSDNNRCRNHLSSLYRNISHGWEMRIGGKMQTSRSIKCL